jgi:hypothetical protein
MRRPDFRGDKYLVTLDARRANALPHLPLVVVHFRGVDVPVAEAQSLFNHARANASAQVPSAEAEQRDARAFSLYGRDVFFVRV